MNNRYRPLALAMLTAFYLTTWAQAQTSDDTDRDREHRGQRRGYVETDLVVNKQIAGVPTLTDSNGITHVAKFFDENLVNPWGLTESGTSAFWVADGGAGVSSLYNTAGAPQPLVVSMPRPDDPLGSGATPTGAVFNNVPAVQRAFVLSGVSSAGVPVTAPAVFLFATKEGTILGWNPGVNPEGFDPAKAGKYGIVAVNNSATAAYTGLAIATGADGSTRLYAANFRAGTVDVFDSSFAKVAVPQAFVDPYLPRGYAPFNVAAITRQGTTRMFVTYAIQDLNRIFGQGHGIVNTFNLDGSQLRRFAQHGQLNAPWGVVQTPERFGELGGLLWIGNFGDGRINAYDPATGEFVNKVRNSEGKAITIDRLWAIQFGNGGNGGSTNTLYFTAGPNEERDGLFGSLDPGVATK
jgi:uncharacterized protein (TIGR03118 family)